MDKEEFIAYLKEQVKLIGSHRKAAEAWGISANYIADLLQGRRDPSPAILKSLGLKKVVEYIYPE